MDLFDLMIKRFPFMLFALLITLIVETFFYSFLKKGDKKFLIFVLLMNTFLNALMNVILLCAKSEEMYYLILLVSEIATIIIEALLITFIFRLKAKEVVGVVLSANVVSFFIGAGFYTLGIIDERKGPTCWTLILTFYVLIFLCSFLFTTRQDNNNDNNRD